MLVRCELEVVFGSYLVSLVHTWLGVGSLLVWLVHCWLFGSLLVRLVHCWSSENWRLCFVGLLIGLLDD